MIWDPSHGEHSMNFHEMFYLSFPVFNIYIFNLVYQTHLPQAHKKSWPRGWETLTLILCCLSLSLPLSAPDVGEMAVHRGELWPPRKPLPGPSHDQRLAGCHCNHREQHPQSPPDSQNVNPHQQYILQYTICIIYTILLHHNTAGYLFCYLLIIQLICMMSFNNSVGPKRSMVQVLFC